MTRSTDAAPTPARNHPRTTATVTAVRHLTPHMTPVTIDGTTLAAISHHLLTDS